MHLDHTVGFFDGATAWWQPDNRLACLHPGGVAAVSLLVEGTTHTDMPGPEGHCLFRPDGLLARFESRESLDTASQGSEAPGGTEEV